MTGQQRTVTTSVTGRASHEPEQATVTVSATGRGPDAETAREAAVEQAAAVRDALADVAHERVRTTGFQTRRRPPHREEQPPYQGVESLAVDADPADGDSVVVAVTGAGATVDEVAFSLAAATRRETRRRALSDAMASARRQAETVAAAEGLAVGAVRDATAGDVRSPGRGVALQASEDSGSAADFQPGPVEITADVEVVYALVED